ncbi:MAG: hypothetical protein H6621_11030 [Halobacteriovoraceae bacterium]|nr:hypothetical protein [Halobacteriovoraceae bacterium]MCB9095591.1 hypothetical protein [Halobacteriovoraceae bacterium]
MKKTGLLVCLFTLIFGSELFAADIYKCRVSVRENGIINEAAGVQVEVGHNVKVSHPSGKASFSLTDGSTLLENYYKNTLIVNAKIFYASEEVEVAASGNIGSDIISSESTDLTNDKYIGLVCSKI